MFAYADSVAQRCFQDMLLAEELDGEYKTMGASLIGHSSVKKVLWQITLNWDVKSHGANHVFVTTPTQLHPQTT